ncbi:MAG: hypothetical protein HN353_02440 [Bdellovibrionales bacterium]|jgi:hypothetical protein|nr:hypothetical protein [Bdellovibrionales bacterium]MBT3525545.1 hypothetical protein [Bdellovibrionales bacterium]MBT7667931.1 hypothetical protein [Bdellovibrionales bacterium]MBT7767667.1 hypothetical protein [Bdellovibrionales bacterium]
MKRIFLLITLCWMVTSVAMGKIGQEGHGGDIVVAEFILRAKNISQQFEKIEQEFLPDSEFALLFKEAVESTKISSAEHVYLDNVEVDAINYPDLEESMIVIGRNRWLDQRITPFARNLLVIHEYLSIIGYRDIQYALSYELTETIQNIKEEAINN